jgi:hypothetical protein
MHLQLFFPPVSQHMENVHIKQLLDKKNIPVILYTRYVDDILITFDTTPISTDQINKFVNKIHTNIKLNPTYKSNRCINYLYLLILQKNNYIETDVYRKPTTMDTTINFLSNHPTEHKLAAYRYHITRMHSLPLTPE